MPHVDPANSPYEKQPCRRAYVLLGIILLLALGVRFWHLDRQGLFFYDEAWYRLTAQTYVEFPQWLSLVFQHHVNPQAAFNQVYAWGFFPDISYKPPYIVLLMLSDCLFGMTNPASGGYLSALLGTLIVGFVFFITRQLTGCSKAGLLCALLASVSGMEVYYSRITLPHQFAAFMLTGLCWLYLLRLQRRNMSLLQHFLLGFLTMSILNAHDMMLPIVVLLAAFEMGVLVWHAYWRFPDWRKTICYFAGLAIPAVFWETVTDILRKLFHRTLHNAYVTPYYHELAGHIGSKTGKKLARAAVDYGYYFHALATIEGRLFLLMLGVGMAGLLYLFLKKRASALFFFGFLSLACLGMITVFPNKVLRLMAPFMPLFIVITACGFYALSLWFEKWLRSPRILAALVGVLFLFTLFPMANFSLGLIQRTSGYAAVADSLRSRLQPGESLGTPYMLPVYTFYLQRKIYIVRTPEDFKLPDPNQRIAYVVFDDVDRKQLCHIKGIACQSKKSAASDLETTLAPYQVQRFQNPYLAHLPFVMEHYYSFAMAQWLTQNANQVALDQIRLDAIPAGFPAKAPW